MIRPARSADRATLRDLQTHLAEPNPALLHYAVDGPPLVLVSVGRRKAPRTGSGEDCVARSATESERRSREQRPASATPKDDPVGYLVAFYDGETGYVAELVVAPAYRREGRARDLLATTFDRLRDEGCSSVGLAVHPDNDAGRRLYESTGFEERGREDDYYDDGRAAVMMGRDL